MIAGQIIQTKEIGTILILLAKGDFIKLYNVALPSKYDLNLISLRKLYESRITYQNNPITIVLMRNGKLITWVKRD